jgi:hypothetical protein
MNYKDKYLKYKSKYLKLKYGGTNITVEKVIDFYKILADEEKSNLLVKAKEENNYKYNPNKDNIKNKEYKKMIEEHFDILENNGKYFSFNDVEEWFEKTTKNLIEYLNSINKNIILYHENTPKSFILFNTLFIKYLDKYNSLDLIKGIYNNNFIINNEKINEEDIDWNKYVLIVCDDGIYSGKQFTSRFSKFYNYIGEKLIPLIMVINNEQENIIKQLKDKGITKYINYNFIKPFNNKLLVWFQYKVPDYESFHEKYHTILISRDDIEPYKTALINEEHIYDFINNYFIN